jgi:hypothetical protein
MEGHVQEERLEMYAMGRLGESEVAEVEEHLLLCEICQEELTRVDEFLKAFRVAAPAVEAAKAKSGGGVLERTRRWLVRIRDEKAVTYAAPSLALAALALVVMVPGPGDAPVAKVELRSERGAGIVNVAAGRRLSLFLDARGLPAAPTYRVELADANGSVEWTGPGSLSNETLAVVTGKAVGAGRHWVRIYGDSGGGERLLREFGVVSK